MNAGCRARSSARATPSRVRRSAGRPGRPGQQLLRLRHRRREVRRLRQVRQGLQRAARPRVHHAQGAPQHLRGLQPLRDFDGLPEGRARAAARARCAGAHARQASGAMTGAARRTLIACGLALLVSLGAVEHAAAQAAQYRAPRTGRAAAGDDRRRLRDARRPAAAAARLLAPDPRRRPARGGDGTVHRGSLSPCAGAHGRSR